MTALTDATETANEFCYWHTLILGADPSIVWGVLHGGPNFEKSRLNFEFERPPGAVLITSSNFVNRWTGRSAGLHPKHPD